MSTTNHSNNSAQTNGSAEPQAVGFRYYWGDFQETHLNVESFKLEHPEVAGTLLEVMLALGISRVAYQSDGQEATIEVVEL